MKAGSDLFGPTAAGGLRSALLITALVFTVYYPALFAGFVFDDAEYIVNNTLLGSAAGLRRIWTDPLSTIQYYPLVYTSFWLEHQLVGTRPLLYHLDNLALHALVAFVFRGILLRLGAGAGGALLAAAVFAVHPVHVESVAWVAQRKNLLSGLFYLLGAAAYLRYAGVGEGGAVSPSGGEARRRWLAAAFVFYGAALLSKAVTLTLPAALLLVLWSRRELTRRTGLPLVPMAVAGVLMGLAATWLESNHAGAAGGNFAFSPLQRLLIAGRAFWFYLSKLVWPVDLSLIYPRWSIDSGITRQILYPVAAAATGALLWGLRGRLGRVPIATFSFYAATLAPTLGLINFYFMLYSFVGDHFQYLASLGPIALAGYALGRLDEPGRFRRGALLLVAASLLLPLGLQSRRHARVFANDETLWLDTVRVNPAAEVAHGNLGVIHESRGQWERAEAAYRTALALRPGYVEARNNLGALLANRGRVAEGLEQFLAASRHDPDDATAHLNAARALRLLGRNEQAALHQRELERLLGEGAPTR